MTLSTGTKLAHYEITSQIGKGGMGEVYQAKDTKLGRDVAIKVLPEEFARDTDRVARFQREAKLLASLNHPNIAAIHGMEEAEGTHFLVLELVEGDTLADRLKRGPIPVEEALKLALQIAEALEAAHEKGVIHRDLKPANIKITPDSKVKVLDFGLAKAFTGDQGEVNLADSPTITAAATQRGVILGTAAYMSPEQAKGKVVDKRTDIWAFGCVLFEMLTGQAVFQGEDVTEILASVVKEIVNLDLLPENIHPRAGEIISHCLQKDLKKRYADIADTRYDIKQALEDPGGLFAPLVNPVEPRKKLRQILPWIAATLILTAVIVGFTVWKLKPIEPRHVIRFDYDLPKSRQFSLSDFLVNFLAVSSDGRNFVYSTSKGLYLRSIDQMEFKLIPGTEGAPHSPFFSPDGQWIGFFSESERMLKKIPISGGTAIPLSNAMSAGGFCWTLDNRILYGHGKNVLWVSAAGGNWEPLIEEKNGLLGSPQMLPDGESVLFADHVSLPYKIMVHSLKTGKTRELLEGASPHYTKAGHIVYGAGDNLCAVPFDIDTLEVTGEGIPVVEGISNTAVFYHYAISDSGTLIYVPGDSTALNQRVFVWVDREGKEELIPMPPDDYYDYFRISPDGMRMALTIRQGGRFIGRNDIFIYDLARETSSKFTFTGIFNGFPVWTPDSRWLIFDSRRNEERESIYWKAADGTGKVERIKSIPDIDIWPVSLSNDGNTLFFVQNGLLRQNVANDDIGMLAMKGERTSQMLLQEQYVESWPQISPDGQWLAYMSNESGQYEIYVRPFPDVKSGGLWQVSTNGGEFPLWSPGGEELYYCGTDAIMAVPVETGASFKHEKPKSLFPNKYIGQFDIHPNGEKFLMLKESGGVPGITEKPQPKINIVLNWFEELKQKVPVP